MAFRQPSDANRDNGVPALLRHRVASETRSACHRSRGWYGLFDGGAAGAGGIPAGGAHQAN